MIAIDQLMTEMAICLSSLHFSCDMRQMCLGPFSFLDKQSSCGSCLAAPFLQESNCEVVFVKEKNPASVFSRECLLGLVWLSY